ncbi:MAG: RrF2 family transcriptional regulator [bacterium]
MLRITKKTEYGIIALKHILNKPEGRIVKAKEIAELYNIPSEIMAKILQKLTRNGIICSTQGAKGGYLLARAGSKISLSDIIETIEGPFGIVECMNDDDCNCMQITNCNISDPFRIIQQRFKTLLANISLADLDNELEIQKVVV